MREFILAALMISLCFAPIGAANEEVDPLEEAGVSIIAFRNDSLDSNQDGMMDAIRVVIVLNSTNDWVDLTLTLLGDHAGFVVVEELPLSFEDQINASITYDSWATGEHNLALEISDSEGRLLERMAIGVFDMTPALSVPEVDLKLKGSDIMETGDSCTIERHFIDETGPRWGEEGTRSITGVPFKVLDTDQELDCSSWPAGIYIIEETYTNGLGQSASDTLEMVIENRPPPMFSISINGDQGLTGTPCTITHNAAAGEDHTDFTKDWTISPSIGLLSNSSTVDCSQWAPGVYRVLLTVTNSENIVSTEGAMLVRLPTAEDAANADSGAPVQSRGEETETTSVGIWGMVVLSMVLGIVVFMIMVRSPEDDELGLSMLNDMGEPDSEGLPTHVDESGIVWRRHTDGEMDWWDQNTLSWRRW